MNAADTSGSDSANEALLALALDNLSTRGYIEYTGEYGAEITTFIPFVAWLKREGHLEGRRVITFAGMRPYYFFLADEEFETKPQRRLFRPEGQRKWPSNSTHTATRQRWHAPPDYRSHYAGRGPSYDRPVLFIQNKFAVEWATGPINYLPLVALNRLIGSTTEKFQVVYSRPGASIEGKSYTSDHNSACDYPDLEIVRRFAGVEILEETCLRDGIDYNTRKLEIAAKAHVFVAVQGGGAHVLACFDNALLLVLHREGREYPHAYAHGPYKFLADPAPLLLVARDNDGLANGIRVIAATSVVNGKPVVGERAARLIDALRL